MQCILWYSKCIALHFQLLQLAHLTDRWLNFYETRMNRLIGSTCFKVQSKKKKKKNNNNKAKHGKYSEKVHSGKYSTQYIKSIWKLRYEFADARIN